MGVFECLILAVALSMDAFAVAFGKGLVQHTFQVRFALLTGLWFGIFQAAMPLLGYFLGIRFSVYVEHLNHWIAFFLLLCIGCNMIYESTAPACDMQPIPHSFSWKTMLPLAVATSIDAFAVGITFSVLHVDLWQSIALIGFVTFAVSIFGVCIGSLMGQHFAAHAELFGGVILILIGGHILLQHIFF